MTVRYFAAAAETAGRDDELLDGVATAGALLVERYGDRMAHILDVGSLLVDGVVTRDPQRPIRARVDVLPPFAGG